MNDLAIVYNIVGRTTLGGYPLTNQMADTKKFLRALEMQSDLNYDLVLLVSGKSQDTTKQFGSKFQVLEYRGRGWDIGAYLYAAEKLQAYQYLIFFNSQTLPASPDFIKKARLALQIHNPDLFGFSSSFEFSKHLRTSCIGGRPQLFHDYPTKVNSRYDAAVGEHSDHSLTGWATKNGNKLIVIYKDHVADLDSSRNFYGVFRNGDQSQLLISDKHTRFFTTQGETDRRLLSSLADGLLEKKFQYRNRFEIALMRNRFVTALVARIRGFI